MNKMKKLLFFSVAIGLLLNINAQTNVQIIENRTLVLPTTTHQRFVEQTRNVFLVPKDFSASHDKPVHKANYEVHPEQISNIQYAANALGGHPVYRPVSNSKSLNVSGYTELFPDSLLSNYIYDIGTVSTSIFKGGYKDQPFASTGFVFDPYSLDFDQFGLKGLFRDAEGVGYGYRLDTLWFVMDYRLPHGYNPNSPDTLRFYISSHNFYNVDSNSREGYYSTFLEGGNLFTPYIIYANPFQDEGPYVTTPRVYNNSTIIEDYILTDQDSIDAGKNMIGWRKRGFIIENGFPVSAGALLSVVVKYIPGYTYVNNDTISVITWNLDKTATDTQYVSGSIQNNYFGIANWTYDTATSESLFDQTGYNGSLHEPQYIRYRDLEGSDKWRRETYHPGYFAKPVFYMSLSVSGDDDTVHISDPPHSVTQIANLISNIYPNPATTQLTIDLANAGEANAIIYNMLGQEVLQKTLNNMSNRINIATLPPGMYVVKVKQNEKIHTVKMSKK
jgi:hypothetical protein